MNKGQFSDYIGFWGPKLNDELDELHYNKEHNWAQGPDGDYGNTACGFVFHRAFILRDGTMVLCCTDFNAEYDFGNVNDAPLLDLWNGPRWQEVRRIHSEGKRNTMKLCDRCDIPELNDHGEFNVKMTPSGRVFSTDTMTPFENQVSRSQPQGVFQKIEIS